MRNDSILSALPVDLLTRSILSALPVDLLTRSILSVLPVDLLTRSILSVLPVDLLTRSILSPPHNPKRLYGLPCAADRPTPCLFLHAVAVR